MEEKKYVVTLEDGTQIKNLFRNGSYFVSDEHIDPEIFDGNLGEVHIDDGGFEEVHRNMAFVNEIEIDGGYGFAFREMSQYEIEMAKFRSDLDYLGMMTEVDF